MTHLFMLCREVNVALALFAAAAYYVRVNDIWPRLVHGGRVMVLGLLLVLVNAAYASAEALLDHAPTGPRTATTTFVLAITFVGCLLVHRNPDQH